MQPRIVLGAPGEAYCRPLLDPLRGKGEYDVICDAPASLAKRMESHTLHAAFLSPIDYAHNASEYYIVPGVAVSSPSGNDSLVIHFRKGVKSIMTLAVHPASASDIILAKVLLAERFDVRPSIVPVAGTLDDMLAKADAALLAGDVALRNAGTRPGALDLVEEWTTVTDLPYVHGFWCGREKTLTEKQWQTLGAAPASRSHDEEVRAGEEDPLLTLFTYEFNETVQEGVREFLRYAYYHGILQDVPDLRFYRPSDSPSSDVLGLN